MQTTVVITDHGFAGIMQEKEILESADARVIEAKCTTEEEVLEVARDADALLVQWAPVTAKVIRELSKCRVIVRYGIGVDNIDLQAARERQIPVCNVPDYCVEEVAVHTMALALALHRRLFTTDSRIRGGVWSIIPPGAIPAAGDAVFTTLGFGRIAQTVAQKAQALGFRTAACDPYTGEDVMQALGVRKVTFSEAIQESDILSLHLPLTDETRHCINYGTLRAMKPEALVINTSRGALIDTTGLAKALSDGIIGGAALDVFEKEPLEEDHPIRFAPNTVLTSHTAWYSERSIPLLQKLAAEEVRRALTGRPLKNRIA